jgi:hypothetical protein
MNREEINKLDAERNTYTKKIEQLNDAFAQLWSEISKCLLLPIIKSIDNLLKKARDLKEIKDSFQMWYYYNEIRVFFRDIGQGVRNLIKWFPVIWKDRQWDHFFMLYMLQFKLKLMSKFFKTGSCSMRSEEDASNMDKCIYLLERIMKEDYKGSYDHQDYMMKQDLTLLFEIMRKQVRAWWD